MITSIFLKLKSNNAAAILKATFKSGDLKKIQDKDTKLNTKNILKKL